MIRKSIPSGRDPGADTGFSEKIMLNQKPRAGSLFQPRAIALSGLMPKGSVRLGENVALDQKKTLLYRT
jgi:hypothetical protein